MDQWDLLVLAGVYIHLFGKVWVIWSTVWITSRGLAYEMVGLTDKVLKLSASAVWWVPLLTPLTTGLFLAALVALVPHWLLAGPLLVWSGMTLFDAVFDARSMLRAKRNLPKLWAYARSRALNGSSCVLCGHDLVYHDGKRCTLHFKDERQCWRVGDRAYRDPEKPDEDYDPTFDPPLPQWVLDADAKANAPPGRPAA